MNERQEYLLYKARMAFETARDAQNKHCDAQTASTTSKRIWGEQMDILNGKLATEAVEYINVLNEAYERRGYEIEDLKTKAANSSATSAQTGSRPEGHSTPDLYHAPLPPSAFKGRTL